MCPPQHQHENLNMFHAKTQEGLGSMCIPGVVVALENLVDKPGFVVLWFETDGQNIRESYSPIKQSVFSASGACSFADTVVKLFPPFKMPQLRLEVWEWLNEAWNIRSLSEETISPEG